VFATRNIQFRFGGQITDLASGGQTLSGHINDCTLEVSFDSNNFAAKVVIDLKNKLFGTYDVIAAGMPNPINVDLRYDHLKLAKFSVQLGTENPKRSIFII
jgi:hypothetical protein